jgi:hypothetical protein
MKEKDSPLGLLRLRDDPHGQEPRGRDPFHPKPHAQEPPRVILRAGTLRYARAPYRPKPSEIRYGLPKRRSIHDLMIAGTLPIRRHDDILHVPRGTFRGTFSHFSLI